MSNGLLLLPDFLLIVCGFLLARYSALDRTVWDGAERLVYYLLFPVLLFNSIVNSHLQPAQTITLAAAGVAITLCGVGLAFALRRWPGVDPHRHASGAQVAFRFNSLIALALIERLGGAQGVAWMALVVALCVPVANLAAVWSLARHGGHDYLHELLRNPLIISTAAGLLVNMLGITFPTPVSLTMQRIGVAALPVALLAVGAGLKLGGLAPAPGLAAALLGIRHVLLPAIGIALAMTLLPPAQRQVVVLFAALPTASSAYVLAVRMKGDAAYVAGLVTVSTVLGMLSVPLWLAVLGALGRLI